MEKVNALEVIREAMHIEKEGIKFYKKAAKVCKDRKTKELFERLADDELNHLEKLELVFDGLAENNEWLVDLDLLDAKPKVLEATEVFDQDLVLDESLDEPGALDHGIKAEEDSIRLYRKALDDFNAEGEKASAIFKWLLEFEKGHLKLLKDRKKALK